MKDFIKIILISNVVTSGISSILWILGDDNDKWFSRFFFSMVCLGIYGIIDSIDKLKEK